MIETTASYQRLLNFWRRCKSLIAEMLKITDEKNKI